MKCTISRKELLAALKAVQALYQRGTTAWCRITAAETVTVLGAAVADEHNYSGGGNNVMAVRCPSAVVQVAGEVVLPSKLLRDILSTDTGDSLSLELSEDAETVQCALASSSYPLSILPAIDYVQYQLPAPPPPQECLTVDGARLKAALTRTICALPAPTKACGPKFTRYVRLEPAQGTVRCVATDGHRLHVVDAALDLPEHHAHPAVLISQRGAKVLHKLLRAQPYTYHCDEQRLLCATDTLTLSLACDTDTYVGYEQLLQQKPPTVLSTLPRAALLAGVRTLQKHLQATARQQTQAVGAYLESTTTELLVTDSLRQYQCRVPVTSAEAWQLCCNAKFLQEILQICTSDYLELRCNLQNKPLYFTDPQGPDGIYLVMPIAPS